LSTLHNLPVITTYYHYHNCDALPLLSIIDVQNLCVFKWCIEDFTYLLYVIQV